MSPTQAPIDSEDLLDARTVPVRKVPEPRAHATPQAPQAPRMPPTAPKRRPILTWLAVSLLVLGGGAYGVRRYLASLHYESTDNAFVEGRVVAVSPRISAHVLRVHITDNQHVAAGDLLVELDPADFETRAAEARSAVAAAQARIAAAQAQLETVRTTAPAAVEQERSAVASAQANLQAAQAEAQRAATDLTRYESLFQSGGITASQLDTFRTAAAATDANRTAAEKRVGEAQARLASVSVAAERIAQAEAEVTRATAELAEKQAKLTQAELDLSYTKIRATESGTVTKKAIEPGNYVRTGQSLFGLVADEKWVVANYKETQLEHMRPGQLVAVRIDAYPDLALRGHVESIQRGTGARFSMLPAENATGNYVKVVQRVPVKIIFDTPLPTDVTLSLGMSVVPSVQVR